MILNLLTLIHAALAVISLYAGTMAFLKILAGQSFAYATSVFLKVALAASVTALLFPTKDFHASYLTAMATVYVAASAVLAWRGFHLSRRWGLIFVLCLIGVFCLTILVIIQHVFDWLFMLNMATPPSTELPRFIAESAVALLFMVMCIFVASRYWDKPSRS